MAPIRFINPQGLSRPPSYTQVVEITGPSRTVYISGQLGTAADGELVGGGFRAQAVQVFTNLDAALAAVGASFADIVKLNSYLAHIADLPILREVRARYLDAAAPPASTTLAVPGFAREGALLEIEAIAVLPQAARKARGAKAARPKRAAGAQRVKSVRRRGR